LTSPSNESQTAGQDEVQGEAQPDGQDEVQGEAQPDGAAEEQRPHDQTQALWQQIRSWAAEEVAAAEERIARLREEAAAAERIARLREEQAEVAARTAQQAEEETRSFRARSGRDFLGADGRQNRALTAEEREGQMLRHHDQLMGNLRAPYSDAHGQEAPEPSQAGTREQQIEQQLREQRAHEQRGQQHDQEGYGFG
jgi:hypothetical protein